MVSVANPDLPPCNSRYVEEGEQLSIAPSVQSHGGVVRPRETLVLDGIAAAGSGGDGYEREEPHRHN